MYILSTLLPFQVFYYILLFLAIEYDYVLLTNNFTIVCNPTSCEYVRSVLFKLFDSVIYMACICCCSLTTVQGYILQSFLRTTTLSWNVLFFILCIEIYECFVGVNQEVSFYIVWCMKRWSGWYWQKGYLQKNVHYDHFCTTRILIICVLLDNVSFLYWTHNSIMHRLAINQIANPNEYRFQGN